MAGCVDDRRPFLRGGCAGRGGRVRAELSRRRWGSGCARRTPDAARNQPMAARRRCSRAVCRPPLSVTCRENNAAPRRSGAGTEQRRAASDSCSHHLPTQCAALLAEHQREGGGESTGSSAQSSVPVWLRMVTSKILTDKVETVVT